ncbi:hypothetical protein L0F63_003122 [Massospora cicadina]|nr:hypothetical protein L0F63_003122 [Massospora cicadina]
MPDTIRLVLDSPPSPTKRGLFQAPRRSQSQKLVAFHLNISSLRFKKKNGAYPRAHTRLPPPPFNFSKKARNFANQSGKEPHIGSRRTWNRLLSLEHFRLRGHQKDMVFDIKDLWKCGLTRPVEFGERILERKLFLALERVEHLEQEVDHLKSLNRTLTLRNSKAYPAEEVEEQPFFNEYWFLCQQYNELQKRCFERSAPTKRRCKDAAVQCDIPETSHLPHPQPRFLASGSQASLPDLPPKASRSQPQNYPQLRQPPPQNQPDQFQRKPDGIAHLVYPTGGLSSERKFSDEKLIPGRIADTSFKNWLTSFKEFRKEQPFYRAPAQLAKLHPSPGSPSSGSDPFDELTLIDDGFDLSLTSMTPQRKSLMLPPNLVAPSIINLG